MSTKGSLIFGENFHLYKEVFEEEAIYLELENANFEAYPDRVVVGIPIQVWAVIRQYQAIDFTDADQTDKEIYAMVEGVVDNRIEKYQATEEGSARRLSGLTGAMLYGSPEDSREDQIRRGFEHFRHLRDLQKKVQLAVKDSAKNDSQ